MATPPDRLHRKDMYDPILRWTDAWNGTFTYAPGDVATRFGAQYVCIVTHTNQAPPNPTYWASESWTAFSYVNSWTDYGSGFSTGAYRRDQCGYVHLKGLVKSGYLTVITTLPVGYRPVEVHLFGVEAGGVFGRVDVGANGTITHIGGGTNPNSYLQLNGITWLAEQ